MPNSWKPALLTCLCLFLLGACAVWKPVEGPLQMENYSVEVPDGWMRFDTDAYVMISRDGPFLQYVLLQERPLRQPFRHTRKTFSPEMLAPDAARIVIDDLQADPALSDFEILSNEPAVIDEQEGFKLVFRYHNRNGLPLQTVYYGFIRAPFYYSLRYTSVERHYFQKDLAVFEGIRSSFKYVSN